MKWLISIYVFMVDTSVSKVSLGAGALYLLSLTLVPVESNRIYYKVWRDIIYPYPSFNIAAAEER